MKIAICDDKIEICRQIKEFIERLEAGCRIVLYASGEELLAAADSFDIIFLDIQMGGMDGIAVAREIRRRNVDAVLIFITGIREAVFKAFDVSAFHYLLKPVNEEKFEEVFWRAEAAIRRRRGQAPLVVRTGGRSLSLERRDILYLESRGRKVEIHRKGQPAYVREYDRESIGLKNGEIVWLARRKYEEFVKAYMHYLRRRRGWDENGDR